MVLRAAESVQSSKEEAERIRRASRTAYLFSGIESFTNDALTNFSPVEKAEKANAIKAEKRDGSSEHFSSLFSSSSSDSVNASANAGVGMTPYMMSLPEDQRKRNERLRARFSVQKSALTSLGNLNSHITDNLEVLEKNAAVRSLSPRSQLIGLFTRHFRHPRTNGAPSLTTKRSEPSKTRLSRWRPRMTP